MSLMIFSCAEPLKKWHCNSVHPFFSLFVMKLVAVIVATRAEGGLVLFIYFFILNNLFFFIFRLFYSYLIFLSLFWMTYSKITLERARLKEAISLKIITVWLLWLCSLVSHPPLPFHTSYFTRSLKYQNCVWLSVGLKTDQRWKYVTG